MECLNAYYSKYRKITPPRPVCAETLNSPYRLSGAGRVNQFNPNPDLLVWPPNPPKQTLWQRVMGSAWEIAGSLGLCLVIAIMQTADAHEKAETARLTMTKEAAILVACLNGGGAMDFNKRELHLCDKATRHSIGEEMK